MRKIFLGMVAVVASLCCLSLVKFGSDCTYYRTGVVTEVSSSEFVVDADNNEWVVIGNGFKIGDRVKLTMDTNGTDTYIYDDIVKDAVIER